MVKVLPVASGKGGVGKSVIALNLAVSLANSGKTVVLADFDLGGSSQHLLLGMSPKGEQSGVGSLIVGHERRLEDLVTTTGYKRLHFISGDAMMPQVHQISSAFKKTLVADLHRLVADYLILDLGAGSNYTVVDFFLSSYSGLIVAMPEVTSIMAAYSFLKTALFRLLYRLYRPGSKERTMIVSFVSERIEGSNLSFVQLLDRLTVENRLAGEQVRAELEKMAPQLVLNQYRHSDDEQWVERLIAIVRKKLGIKLECVARVPYDDLVRQSVAQRRPLLMSNSISPFASKVNALATIVASEPSKSLLMASPKLYDDDELLPLKPKTYY